MNGKQKSILELTCIFFAFLQSIQPSQSLIPLQNLLRRQQLFPGILRSVLYSISLPFEVSFITPKSAVISCLDCATKTKRGKTIVYSYNSQPSNCSIPISIQFGPDYKKVSTSKNLPGLPIEMVFSPPYNLPPIVMYSMGFRAPTPKDFSPDY